jgi:2-oxoglutarate ferredoxin oxidoreductase subunit alpha
VQEAVDLTVLAFDLAEKYRSITVVLLDGSLGQMMEPAELPAMQPIKTQFPEWATRGAQGRERRMLSSIYLDPPQEEEANFRIMRRWQQVEANEVRCKEYFMEDAEFAVVGFGSSGRVSLSAVRQARAEGIKVGLIRPITLNPYPVKVLEDYSKKLKAMLVVEMNAGQMLEDVLRMTSNRLPVDFYGRMGGIVPFPDEVLAEIQRIAKGGISTEGHPRDRWLKRMAEIN